MQVVRKMYALRFPGMDTSGMTLKQVRGMEGIRVRKTYELFGKTTGVKWKKRTYKTDSWEASDTINQALSEANAMLYGVCHAAIISMGFSPGLGFIHTASSYPSSMTLQIFTRQKPPFRRRLRLWQRAAMFTRNCGACAENILAQPD